MSYPAVGYSAQVLPASCQAPRNRWQEWFSWAFVQSVANAAGLVAQVPTIDSNKKDVLVETWQPLNGRMRVVGLQLKSTYNPTFVENHTSVAFDLDQDDYNGMVMDGNVPRFLVVVAVPRPPTALVSLGTNNALLEAAGWWGKVEGDLTDQKTKRVKLPASQRLDADGLLQMLEGA
jgi:hypothetical protein